MAAATRTVKQRAAEAIAWLAKRGTKANRDGMARYGIPSTNAFGVTVGDLRQLGKKMGRDHDLSLALWDSGRYEARMLIAFIGEPERLTPALMDRWAKDFDSWAVCDALCFHLFDRSEHAWKKVDQWAARKEEFVRRASFALLASLSVHDKVTGDAPFTKGLKLIEKAATDDRNFVKKAVNWALRSIGKRNAALNAAAIAVARRLAERPEAAARWVGKDALRELTGPSVARRLAKQTIAKKK